MARVTHVKSAQQRYETVPVLDENGNPVKIPLTTKSGAPKMTRAKAGRTSRPVSITKTIQDRTKPLPPYRCDFPGCDIDGGKILPGTPYKWIKPKSGPYGGRRMNRHAAHPSWNVWDYSSSLSAQVARIENDATSEVDSLTSADDAQSILDNAAQEIRDLAEQKREGASNIEDGFGHPTSMSEELEQQADELDAWADEVEGTEIPDQSEYASEVECDECDGTGEVENEDYDEDDEDSEPERQCDECGGTGRRDWQDGDDLSDEDLDEWRQAVSEAISDAIGNCPV